MSNSKTASRYAKATLDLCLEKGTIEEVYVNMQALVSTIEESTDLQSLIKSPVVKEEEKMKVFSALFGKTFNQASIDLISLLANNKRESIVKEVADQFIAQYKTHKNIVTANITSATKLEETQRQNVLNLLKHDGEVEIIENIDPTLIGGFIIRVGDKQIDASIATKFKNLRKEISLN